MYVSCSSWHHFWEEMGSYHQEITQIRSFKRKWEMSHSDTHMHWHKLSVTHNTCIHTSISEPSCLVAVSYTGHNTPPSKKSGTIVELTTITFPFSTQNLNVLQVAVTKLRGRSPYNQRNIHIYTVMYMYVHVCWCNKHYIMATVLKCQVTWNTTQYQWL